jgi:prenyl protein peptidase
MLLLPAPTAPLRFAAGAAALLVPVIFVASLYAIPSRLRALPRDDPTHVAARFAALSVAALVAPVPFVLLLRAGGIGGSVGGAPSAWQALGVAADCNGVLSALAPVALTATLFLGPLVEFAVTSCACAAAHAAQHRIIVARNLAVAPVVEEWVFRASLLPLLALAGASHAGALLCAAALFGAAHAHHYAEYRRRGLSPRSAASTVGGILAFTSAFALITAHAFLRTGSVAGVIGAHALANAMGPPSFAFVNDERHRARALVAAAYAVGVCAFVGLVATDAWVPPPHGGGGGCALSPP